MYIEQSEIKLVNYLNGKSGPFNKALFETIFHADVCNLESLKIAFPDEVEVVQLYKTDRGYFERLESAIKENL